jgi:hypothetical protein
MLFSLNEAEIAELASPYRLSPSPVVQPYWERRQFKSTGRYYECVVDGDGTVVIKTLQEHTNVQRGGTPLWL